MNTKIEPAKTKATDLKVKLFRGFSDHSRMSILNALRCGPLTVNEIVEATGLSQSNVSNHLGCLRCCDLVVRQQQGRYVYYQLSDERIAQILDLADELLADVAKGVNSCSRYNHKEGD
ncbi:ArsR/SmtB family transcription factor [Scytonema sp. PRP1]|uniref:ArsR/SmtB family transcription factor n=1 Tax=Scytonema sp. PRP1 TaxID=3120513 RepID=UPI00300C9563